MESSLNYPWISPVLARLASEPKGLPRALLLTGRAGLGKRETALFLANGLLCETKRDGLQPCGTCASCLLLKAGNHPDLRVLEVGQEEEPPASDGEDEVPASKKKPARQISVDKVRALADLVNITSHRGGAKVVCITPAEAMHPSAANALLKMLEEPPGETWFILVSHQPDRLLPTIRSRCFRLDVALPDPAAALQWLKEQGASHGALALAQGGYAPLAAKDRDGDETFWTQRKALLDALASSSFDLLKAADHAEEMDNTVVATLLSRWAFDIAALKSGGGARYHLDYLSPLQKIARSMPFEALLGWYDATLQFGRSAQHPLNKRLAMESLLSGYPNSYSPDNGRN
ncbi:MAG: DNA polymerase III subunit delta' [Betaproteobacteria bacterium]